MNNKRKMKKKLETNKKKMSALPFIKADTLVISSFFPILLTMRSWFPASLWVIDLLF
jgi:hypothetical protein